MRDAQQEPIDEGIFKSWTVYAMSEGEAPLYLHCDDRPATQPEGGSAGPGTWDPPSPVQYLLLAVAGCFALSCRAVLKKRATASCATAEVPASAIQNFQVSVTGDKLQGAGNRLARISVVTQFHDMAEEDAAAVLRDAKALCTVTNTLSGSPAIHYAARSGRHPTAASGQGVDLDVQSAFSRR